jgi:hypothetical protein
VGLVVVWQPRVGHDEVGWMNVPKRTPGALLALTLSVGVSSMGGGTECGAVVVSLVAHANETVAQYTVATTAAAHVGMIIEV